MTKKQFLSGRNKSVYLKNNLIRFFKSEGLKNIEYVQIVNKETLKENTVVKKGDIIITINPGIGYEPRSIIANIDGKIQNIQITD